jgi:hypothetical protein
MPVSRTEPQQTLPRLRYHVCPHCGWRVSTRWRHDYCGQCYRTFSTGKYDKAR